jgi:hypothetical protein
MTIQSCSGNVDGVRPGVEAESAILSRHTREFLKKAADYRSDVLTQLHSWKKVLELRIR